MKFRINVAAIGKKEGQPRGWPEVMQLLKFA